MKSPVFATATAALLTVTAATTTTTTQLLSDEDGYLTFTGKIPSFANKPKPALLPTRSSSSSSSSFLRSSSATSERSILRQQASCVDGSVDVDGTSFACENINFHSLLAFSDFVVENPCDGQCFLFSDGALETTNLADVSGWVSPEGREITLLCTSNAVWFLDSTDPASPLNLGYLYTARPANPACDVEVLGDTLYVGRDAAGDYYDSYQRGLQVFDLTSLVCASAYSTGTPEEFYDQGVSGGFGYSAGLTVINDSIFVSGTNGGYVCDGALALDASDPLHPEIDGCDPAGGYAYAADCVVYSGPDARFTGKIICAFVHDSGLVIYDFTDHSAAEALSILSDISGRSVAFSGDMASLYINGAGSGTLVVDVADLMAAAVSKTLDFAAEGGAGAAQDGPVFDWGLIYPAAAAAGLVYSTSFEEGVLVAEVATGELVASFGFSNATAVSQFMFPSGVLVVPTFTDGVFFLQPNAEVGLPATTPVVSEVDPADCPSKYPTMSPTTPTTSSPTEDCYDNIPSGLVYTGSGNPAPCFELSSFCSLEIVFANCRKTCDRCDITDSPTYGFYTFAPTPAPVPTVPPVIAPTTGIPAGCADLQNPGLNFADGTAAKCWQVAEYCESNVFVRERCVETCGSCAKTGSDVVTLSANPGQVVDGSNGGSPTVDGDSSAEGDYMLVMVVVVTAALTVLLCMGVFTAMMQARTFYQRV